MVHLTGELTIANRAVAGSTCSGGVWDGIPCDPDDPDSACVFFGGVCPPGELITTTFGPPIPGGIPADRDCRYELDPTLSVTPSGSLVVLQWDPHPDAQGYEVFRCDAATGACPPQPLATTSETAYIDDPGPANLALYRVAALGFPCPSHRYCEGYCWSDGVCTDPPWSSCPAQLPMCACNGVTFYDWCQAGWAHLGWWFFGECP
jgi:hypothetical protein